MCISISKVQTNVSPITPAIHYLYATPIIHQFLPSKCVWNSHRKYESNYCSCTNQYFKTEVTKNVNLEMTAYYDTLTDEDTVWKQYSLLPFPTVTREDLEREKAHYNGNNLFTIWKICFTSKKQCFLE